MKPLLLLLWLADIALLVAHFVVRFAMHTNAMDACFDCVRTACLCA